jgi:hypothetical protein
VRRRIGIIAALIFSVAAGSSPHAQTARPAPESTSPAAPPGGPASSATAGKTAGPPKGAAPPVTTSPTQPSEKGTAAAGAEDSAETLVTKASEALKHGEINKAINRLEGALDAVRARAPLRARRFLLVKEDAPAFGQYVPRGNNIFQPGEEMLFYLEPENYTFRRRGDFYETSLRVDVNLLLPDGTVIYGKRNFFEQVFSARSKIHDLYLNLSLEVSGLEEGVYRVEYVVKDGFSNKQVTVHQDVVIREPQPLYYP